MTEWRAWLDVQPAKTSQGPHPTRLLAGKTKKNIMTLASSAYITAMASSLRRLVDHNPMHGAAHLMAELGYQFARALDLVELTTGIVSLQEKVAGKVLPVDLERDRVKELAAALRSQLDAIGFAIAVVPPLRIVPEIGNTRGPNDETWRQIVPLLLNADETVQLILHGRGVGGHHNHDAGVRRLRSSRDDRTRSMQSRPDPTAP